MAVSGRRSVVATLGKARRYTLQQVAATRVAASLKTPSREEALGALGLTQCKRAQPCLPTKRLTSRLAPPSVYA